MCDGMGRALSPAFVIEAGAASTVAASVAASFPRGEVRLSRPHIEISLRNLSPLHRRMAKASPHRRLHGRGKAARRTTGAEALGADIPEVVAPLLLRPRASLSMARLPFLGRNP